MFRDSKNEIALLLIFYAIAHGGILLIPNAIYWDDWTLYHVPSTIIIDKFMQAGSMFNLTGYLHVAMLKTGPWLYKFLTFVLMFASGLLLNSIIKRHPFVKKEARIFIVLLFLVLPFNAARVALMDFPYTICCFMFFLAWVLMDRFRVLALVLFFLSFNTNSLLVFYAIPVFDMMYRNSNLTHLKSASRYAIKKADYFILPFLYFFVKIKYYSPSGIYAGYNQSYSMKNIISGPLYQAYNFIGIDVNVFWSILFSLLAIMLIKTQYLSMNEEQPKSREIFAVGVIVFILGAFPYWILGYVPTFTEWTSRHQLLLPLGTALMIVGALAFNDFRSKSIIISIVVGTSLAFNMANYHALFVDWQKQKQLIQLFSTNSDIKQFNTIVISDKTKHLNALDREYRFYEWNGILRASVANENHFAVELWQYDDLLKGSYDSYYSSQYLAGSYIRDASTSPLFVEIKLVKPEKYSEKMMSRLFPKFALSVSQDAINPSQIN